MQLKIGKLSKISLAKGLSKIPKQNKLNKFIRLTSPQSHNVTTIIIKILSDKK